MYRAANLLMIAFFLFVSHTPIAAQEAPSIQQYFNIRQAGTPAFSPDGTKFAFLWNVTGTNQVWAAKTGFPFPEQLTFFEEAVALVRWSPAEDRLIVGLGKSSEEITTLYTLLPDGSKLEKLSQDGAFIYRNIRLSQDGKQLAYATNDRNPEIFDTYIYDLTTHEKKTIVSDPATSSMPASFSPDQKYLLVSKGDGGLNNNLCLIDLATNAQHLLTQHDGNALFSNGDWTPDSKGFYLTTTYKRDRKTLALMTLIKQGKKTVKGKMSYIDLGESEVIHFSLSSDGKYFTYTLNEGGYYRTIVQNIKTREAVELDRLNEVSSVSFLAGGKKFIITYASPVSLPEVVVYDPASKTKTPVSIPGYAGLSRQAFVTPELFHYYSFDQAKIPAFLYLPKDTKRDSSLTMIVWFHDGPDAQALPFFDPAVQYLVAEGFGVIMPNIRGSSGYGTAYAQADNAAGRETALQDAAAVVQWITLSGFANPDKIVALGKGYGGYLAMAMLSMYPGGWAAGISIGGSPNLMSHARSAKPYQKNKWLAEYGNPDKDAAFLQKISPLSHTSDIRKPLMIVHSKGNPHVSTEEIEQLLNAVRNNGITTDYLVLEDHDDCISRHKNQVRTYTEIVKFINSNVR